jgi:hypothetical protein
MKKWEPDYIAEINFAISQIKLGVLLLIIAFINFIIFAIFFSNIKEHLVIEYLLFCFSVLSLSGGFIDYLHQAELIKRNYHKTIKQYCQGWRFQKRFFEWQRDY